MQVFSRLKKSFPSCGLESETGVYQTRKNARIAPLFQQCYISSISDAARRIGQRYGKEDRAGRHWRNRRL